MRLETWDPSAAVRYDQQRLEHLVSLRFADAGQLEPSSSGPSASARRTSPPLLGHVAVRRRLTVHMARATHLFKKLKAARLDNSTEVERHRRRAAANVLAIDDFALQPLDELATADFYELTVARHRKSPTIVTSNRTPDEWVTPGSDPLLAQSAVDRLASTSHEPHRRRRVLPPPPATLNPRNLTNRAIHPKMIRQPQGGP